MLEFVGIYFLSKKNGQNAEARGQKPTLYKVLTWVLWLGLETLGFVIAVWLTQTRLMVYLLALLFAGVGGLISYLIAANCPQGNYVSPTQRVQQMQRAQFAARPLPAPCTINIVRDKNFVSSLATFSVFLNEQMIGSLSNGQSMMAQTMVEMNVLRLTSNMVLSSDPVLYFSVMPGQSAEIHFSSDAFKPALCRGVRVYSAQEIAYMAQQVPTQQQAYPYQ